jgi:hypothetical protein
MGTDELCSYRLLGSGIVQLFFKSNLLKALKSAQPARRLNPNSSTNAACSFSVKRSYDCVPVLLTDIVM